MEWKESIETPFGKIPDNWKVSRVKDEAIVVTDYVANGSFASLAENVQYKNEEDYAVLIRLVDYNNNFNGNFVFISKESYDFLGKSKLFGDEIIISNVGANVGTVFKCPHLKYKMSLAPNSVMVKFRGDNDFYYYWLKSNGGQGMLHSIVTGSAQPKFNKTNFREMVIPVPPLETQRRIAAILSSLDDKIENNNRINRNLEAQAQALFKSWFVDFEPFGGTMPEDWKEYELGEFLPVITGKKDANIASKTGTYPFFSCAQDILYTENYSFNADAILVAGNGDFNVKWYRGKFEAYQRTYVLIPNDSRYLGWLYYMVKHNLNNITCGARGSVIKFITKGNLENFRFAAPKDLSKCDIIDKFNTINNTIESKKAESARLAALRDALLPKLMRGEISL